MHLLGSRLRAGAVTGPPPVGPATVPWDTRNTDLAFLGKTAIQGRYDGFRVIDITDLSFTSATGTITVEQPPGTVVLTVTCTFSEPTSTGPVSGSNVSCVQS